MISIDISKGWSLLLLFITLNANEASSPFEFSPAQTSGFGFDNNQQPSEAISSYAPSHNNHASLNSIGNKVLAPRGHTHGRNAYVPNGAIRSKRLRSPSYGDGYPPGRIDSAPEYGNNVRNKYAPQAPPPQPHQPPVGKSVIPTKSAVQPRPNRINKPFIDDGYIDASNRGRPIKPSGPKDISRGPPKIPPPPNNRPKTNGVREGRIPIPRPSRPENPFVEKPPFFPGGQPKRPQGPPSPPNIPDYSQGFDQPRKPPAPSSNSSFLSPSNIDFVPFDNKPGPTLPKNPSKSDQMFSDPFKFSNVLGGNQNFAFPSSPGFDRRPQRPRPTRDHSPPNLFKEFSSPVENYAPTSQSKPFINDNTKQRYPTVPNKNLANNYVNNNYNNPRFAPRRDPNARNGGGPGYNNEGFHVDRSQCFQYSFPAEAYRLSDTVKEYPQEDIQKEINMNPYLSPLVGLEAKAVTNDPFTFNAPISSHFDFSGFGFKNDATTSDKYSHLKNKKSFPGNMRQGDLVGKYPSTMQPLDSACPTKEYSLRSFFQHGGDCYVINPDFQQISYSRCTRQDCNFCGVNRGLSACVEEYRWVTVVAYCTALPEHKRITPMRLFLPVGCSCQHFMC